MPIDASDTPFSAAEVERLKGALDDIGAIYTRTFPDRRIELVLMEGSNPQADEPVVLENDLTYWPEQLKASYLGRVVLPEPFPHARPLAAIVKIPPVPTPAQWERDGDPWRAQRGLRRLQAAWPMLYERIRYGAELLRGKLAHRRHSWAPFEFSLGKLPEGLIAPPARPAADKRPAIVIGFHWLEVGGAEKMAFDAVRWAHEAGLRVFVVAGVRSWQRLADKLPDSADVTFIRLDSYLPAWCWPRFMEKLVLQENVRLIHVNHCGPLYEALPQIRIAAPYVKVIDTTHIVEYADGGFVRMAGVWTNYIDMHHVISRKLADFFRDEFLVGDKVRLGRMLTRAEETASLPEMSFKARQKTLNVAFIGRYMYQKRPLVLIQILRRLQGWARRHGVTLKARLVGDGPFRPAAEALVRRYGLGEIVSFIEPGADVPALLDDSDVLLLPSNNEGLALVCYEAIQHGCIPITTDVGAQSEIVPPALLVPVAPAATVRATVKAVDRLWRDPAFLAAQTAALQDLYRKLAADPTAQEVLTPIFEAAASGEEIPL